MQATYVRGAAAYRQTSVQSSSPLGLVVMLYDGALRHLLAARDASARGDARGRRDGLSKAMAIVAELQSTLNIAEGGEIASSLDSLYTYVMERLVAAGTSGDVRPIEEAEHLLRPLREAWSEISAGSR